ncbi:N-6 DNA methylase [Mycoplasmopsis cynos]|uniref:HsdM family class I SAM-dependent methyltransferase n=1 Tax=Mycoplasmopsis cynos TaxID=171284 RepID=UPI002AFFD319|nr:N-6 DNA methylase [Mycoplasmopsis cynos]WQQ16092.1 N-6 DNA methylase [Mycoplasmopsis cynos]
MNSTTFKTEDQVRDELRILTGVDVGQQTSFKQLGFAKQDVEKLSEDIINKFSLNKVLSMKPDGWKFEDNNAIVCETKSSNIAIEKTQYKLLAYMHIAKTKYSNVFGIIYNGNEFKVYKFVDEGPIVMNVKQLESYKNYFNTLNDTVIDKNKIYNYTRKINDILHFKYKLKNLNHRMIWTSCLLIGKRFGAYYSTSDSIKTIKQKVEDVLNKEITHDNMRNIKLTDLMELFKSIRLSEESVSNEDKLDLFDSINIISDDINSNNWNGEDVMAIFFNEFTRYKGKSENGQVFTPDHITSLMYRLAEVHYKDNVLDACCGSGSFLTKAMCNMIKQAGGVTTKEAQLIKSQRIFGIENDPEIFALACANMLLHKDGKTNLRPWDAKSEQAGNWIKDNKITKVLMNPPYEKKSKPQEIIKNVLDNVERNSNCLFLMPNSKLRTNEIFVRKLLTKHRLTHIIKLPDIFAGMANTGDVSIFIFKAHVPQDDNMIMGYFIPEDGLETVKNQGRHDINNIWANDLENYWVNAIKTGEEPRYNSKKIINPNEHLEYPDDTKEFEIYEEDFQKAVLDRILFENPDIAIKLSPYSAKNNPKGISNNDWIINMLKLIGDK